MQFDKLSVITTCSFEQLKFLFRTLKWTNKSRKRVVNRTTRPGRKREQKGIVIIGK